MVEVRFDRLYLTKPQATVVEDEEGNRTSTMPPVNDWAVADVSELDVAESIAALKEGIPLPVVFAVRPVREGGHFPGNCLLYTSPSPRDRSLSRMPSSA